MDEEKYVEATDAFVDLGDYKDSEEKIEEIKIIVLDKQYDAAVILLQEKKYDEATAAFIALDGYKDSNEKIEEINLPFASSLELKKDLQNVCRTSWKRVESMYF
jgi:hypothetical protein